MRLVGGGINPVRTLVLYSPRRMAAPIPIPTPIEVWNYPLPPGFYTFYFALDSQANGTLDGVIWWDSVTILVQ